MATKSRAPAHGKRGLRASSPSALQRPSQRERVRRRNRTPASTGLPALLARSQSKRSAKKGDRGLLGAVRSALPGGGSAASARTPAARAGKTRLAGLLAGAGVGAAALLKRRRDRQTQDAPPNEEPAGSDRASGEVSLPSA